MEYVLTNKNGEFTQDGAPKIAFSCLISGFMVDITN